MSEETQISIESDDAQPPDYAIHDGPTCTCPCIDCIEGRHCGGRGTPSEHDLREVFGPDAPLPDEPFRCEELVDDYSRGGYDDDDYDLALRSDYDENDYYDPFEEALLD